MRGTWGRRTIAAAAAVLLLSACGTAGDDPDEGASATSAVEDAGGAETADDDATQADDGPGAESEEPTDDASSPGPPSEEPPTDGGEEAAEGERLLAAAIEAASDVTTARTRIESVTSTPEGELRVVGEGVQSGVDSRVTMRFSGDAADASGLADGEIEVILLDGVVYQRFPGLTEALGVDATWFSLDVETLGPEFAEILDAAEGADPADALDALREAGDVVVVGTEEVNGVTTTRLRAEVTMRAALEAQGVDESMIAAAGIDVDEPVAYDLWVDDQSRLRRQQVDLVVEGMATSTTVDVLAYDIEVEITAPPEDEVVSFSELFGGGSSG